MLHHLMKKLSIINSEDFYSLEKDLAQAKQVEFINYVSNFEDFINKQFYGKIFK